MLRLTAIGNLAADPRAGVMPSGDPVSNFTVIHNEEWKDQNGNTHERKTALRCTVIGAAAPAANQYLYKGRSIYVEGQLDNDQWGNPKIWVSQAGEARASYNLRNVRYTFVDKYDPPGGTGVSEDDPDEVMAGASQGQANGTGSGYQSDKSTEIPF